MDDSYLERLLTETAETGILRCREVCTQSEGCNPDYKVSGMIDPADQEIAEVMVVFACSLENCPLRDEQIFDSLRKEVNRLVLEKLDSTDGPTETEYMPVSRIKVDTPKPEE